MVDSPLDPTANKSVLTPTDIRMFNSGWVLGYAPSYVINGTTPPADAPKAINVPNNPAKWLNVKPAAPVQTPAVPPVQTANLNPTPNLTPPQGGAPDPMANLARLAGVNMKTGEAYIRKYLQDGGVGLNPKELAWCAAAMNASLAQVGLPGTGSQKARSFLNYGQPVTEPQHGDIVVFQRGGPNSNLGHVGYVDRINPDGSVRVLGGNQSQGVGFTNFPAADVVGYRRIPGAVAVTDPSLVKDVASTQSQPQADTTPAQTTPKTPVEAAGDAVQKSVEGAAKAEEKQKPFQMSPLEPTVAMPQMVAPTARTAYEALMEKVPSMQGGAARTQATAATPPVSTPPKEYMQPRREQQNEQQA